MSEQKEFEPENVFFATHNTALSVTEKILNPDLCVLFIANLVYFLSGLLYGQTLSGKGVIGFFTSGDKMR